MAIILDILRIIMTVVSTNEFLFWIRRYWKLIIIYQLRKRERQREGVHTFMSLDMLLCVVFRQKTKKANIIS